MRKALEAHTKGSRPSIELVEEKLGAVSALAKGIDQAADGAARRERLRS
jgi:hypothetical protein